MTTLRLPILSVLVASVALSVAALPADARPPREGLGLAASGPSVDVSRLRALGLGPVADLVQQAVARELQSVPVASNGRLVVVLTGLSMGSYAGSGGGSGGGGGGGGDGGGGGGSMDTDYLEGEALVLGPGGQILQRHPQVVSLPASSGGAYYVQGAEQRRVIALSRTFAEWLRRANL